MKDQSIISQTSDRKYYQGLDALRVFSAIAILMMHVKANSSYQISGFVYSRLIPSFADLVFLFMAISPFFLCNGYYYKVIKNQFSAISFYKNRYGKILTFFLILIIIDLLHEHSLPALIESITNITCLYGLLPNCSSITVIVVGWFIGVAFVLLGSIVFSYYTKTFLIKVSLFILSRSKNAQRSL